MLQFKSLSAILLDNDFMAISRLIVMYTDDRNYYYMQLQLTVDTDHCITKSF